MSDDDGYDFGGARKRQGSKPGRGGGGGGERGRGGRGSNDRRGPRRGRDRGQERSGQDGGMRCHSADSLNGSSSRGQGRGRGRGRGTPDGGEDRGRNQGGRGRTREPDAPRGGRPNRPRSNYFPLRHIADIKDVDEVTMRLASQIEEFEAFLCSETLSSEDAIRVLTILSRVVLNDLQRESVLKILQVICTSRFLDVHLTSLIQIGFPSFFESGTMRQVVETVKLINQLLSQICLKLPSNATKGFLLLTVLNSMPSIMGVLELENPDLAQSVRDLLVECQQCMAMLHHSAQKKERKARGRRGPNDDDDIPPEDFTELPIFPNFKDMDWTEKIFLRANKEEGAFRDTAHYLDVQFRLLREDYIQPLRKGIKEFKQLRQKGETVKKTHNLRLYHRVQIISMMCKESLEHRLQFELTPQLKKMRWQSSKQLLYGSLVCLSLDDFDTIFFAVVTNRDVKDLEKGILQVRFETGLDEILGPSFKETFTMAETTAYFEAYRHVLEGLQEMKDSLPMSRYLVECNTTIKPPRYLLSKQKKGRMDLTSLLCEDSRYDASHVTVINPQRWPPLDETMLNASQMEAVRTALTKEVAIIQGPPGTGKTFVGLKVAKVLLENQHVWTDEDAGKRPILVVCYTNHALDQFLGGILDFCPEGIVRVGSRCKTPELEEFNLKNLRRQMRTEKKISLSMRNSIRDCLRNMKELQKEVMEASAKLEATTKGVVGTQALQPYMLPRQYESLLTRGKVTTSAGPQNAMVEWLTNGMFPQAGADMEAQCDAYSMLAAEVKSQILQGQGTCPEHTIDPNSVHVLLPVVRAQLYRLWVQKLENILEREAGTPVSQRWQEAAKQDILPDAILQRAVNRQLYSAITQPLLYQHQQQTQFCIRAWLGVSETTPQDVISRIIEGSDVCADIGFLPDDCVTLPRKMRTSLYRSWLAKVKKELKSKFYLAKTRKQNVENISRQQELAKREILSDEDLKDFVDPQVFLAIRKKMLERHEQQAQYLIRTWLGIHHFCQNPLDLEKLLRQLEGDNGEEADEEEQLNIEEEAEIIQNERRLDDEEFGDLFDFGKDHGSRNWDVDTAMQELGVQSTTKLRDSAPAPDDDGWIVPAFRKKQQTKKLEQLLASSKPMSLEEAEGVVNVWSQKLSVESRVRLYLFWLHRYQDYLHESVKEQADSYDQESRQLRELRLGEDKDILTQATVIGMTTTGAARYRRVLSAVACPIIILEEAAEVLEAHVVTTLHKQCQHLILIGDHQQLRPSPTVYDLCCHYNLDLSLFERLVNNQLPHSTLTVQHRMRPNVADLMRHIYPNLKDHVSTMSRPHVLGLQRDVFLLHHEVEEASNDDTSSKSNQHEAELCVRLCCYLLQQGYPSDSVTILTAYSGQVFTLNNIMKKQKTFFQGVRVTSVDNYQGEENDIIILSLVRSNQKGSVGFLGIDNRVCVALSRARNGLYAFGNFKILAAKSELWKKICQTAKQNEQFGDVLTLQCTNHPTQLIQVTTAKDFDKSPEGGCKLPCGTRLEKCGHVCELICHGYDRNHERYKCGKKCERVVCHLDHRCTRKCHQECGPCLFQVQKKIPMCGHLVTMPCSKNPHTWDCKDRCRGVLPCGHLCSGKCGECRRNNTHVRDCGEEVERVWPCGHMVKSPCKVPFGEWPCNRPCDSTLDCGHKCPGSCGQCWAGRLHVACKEKCGRVLPGCGHKCQLPCGTVCLPCKEKSCATSCQHSTCKQSCGVPCLPCKEPCPWRKCEHQVCESLCHQPCQPCLLPCSKLVKCHPRDSQQQQNHPCSGLCGENCFCIKCDMKNFVPLAIDGVLTVEESHKVDEHTKLVKLPCCGHIFRVEVLDVYIEKKCQALPPGIAVTCPLDTCKKLILEKDCWRYHDVIKEHLNRFQAAKRDTMTSTTISKERRDKLLDSLELLTHDAEKEKSFASKSFKGQVFRKPVIDVNTAFALCNQTKLARVFEAALAVLKDMNCLSDQRHPTKDDIQVLQKHLYKPATFLTKQRARELKNETLRFVLMTKLATAGLFSEHLRFKTDSVLKTLGGGASLQGSVLAEVNSLLLQCSRHCRPEWDRLMGRIHTSILDAPLDQDLCDIKQEATKISEVKPSAILKSSDSQTRYSASDSPVDPVNVQTVPTVKVQPKGLSGIRPGETDSDVKLPFRARSALPAMGESIVPAINTQRKSILKTTKTNQGSLPHPQKSQADPPAATRPTLSTAIRQNQSSSPRPVTQARDQDAMTCARPTDKVYPVISEVQRPIIHAMTSAQARSAQEVQTDASLRASKHPAPAVPARSSLPLDQPTIKRPAPSIPARSSLPLDQPTSKHPAPTVPARSSLLLNQPKQPSSRSSHEVSRPSGFSTVKTQRNTENKKSCIIS